MPNFKTLLIVGALALTTCCLFSAQHSSLQAETLVIKDTGQFYSKQKPKKGMSKAQVRKKYGEPMQSSPAVGQPPITRWKYANYTVYFEYNHVVHAVNNSRVRNP